MTYYLADPQLELSHLKDAYISCTSQNLNERENISSQTLNGIRDVMFGESWEVYSFRSFFDRIIGASLAEI